MRGTGEVRLCFRLVSVCVFFQKPTGSFRSILSAVPKILGPSLPAAREPAPASPPSGVPFAPDTPAIREAVLRDPRHPVHRIADRLLPYLRVLVEQFHPQQVILFGSYAYGQPDRHSDVDLLVVMDHVESPLRQRIRIREAWWKMPREESLLAFDLIVVSADRHRERLENSAGFYDRLVERGLTLI
jgi:hypothetical protein